MKFTITFLSWPAKASLEIEGPSLAIAITSQKADLRGADLCGAKIVESGRTHFSVGPIGSRSDILFAYNTNKGVWVTTGCFQPAPVEEFWAAVEKTHGNNSYAKDYAVAVVLIQQVLKGGE
jgi:hypothetical protein